MESGNESKAELLAQIEHGWQGLHAYINALTPDQLTARKDSVGWTVKDHVVHIAVWEDILYALLTKADHTDILEIDPVLLPKPFEEINAVLQERTRSWTMPDVLKTLDQTHARVLAQLDKMSDADLQRPLKEFRVDWTDERPVRIWVVGNTWEHYDEHMPWMKAISG
jgi:hypothetical protein